MSDAETKTVPTLHELTAASVVQQMAESNPAELARLLNASEAGRKTVCLAADANDVVLKMAKDAVDLLGYNAGYTSASLASYNGLLGPDAYEGPASMKSKADLYVRDLNEFCDRYETSFPQLSKTVLGYTDDGNTFYGRAFADEEEMELKQEWERAREAADAAEERKRRKRPRVAA